MSLHQQFFSESWIANGCVQLRAARDLSAAMSVRALISGVEIGSTQIEEGEGLAAGDVLQIQCSYYPNSSLPAQIRFAEDEQDSDIAPPLDLVSHDQIISLVGYGELTEGELHISDGMLMGTAVNLVNAHNRPPLIGRVNGHLLRDVEVTNALSRPGGGATIYFQMALLATDLTDAGARYEILSLPEMRTVAVRTVAPLLGDDGLSAQVIEIEDRVAQLSRRVSHAIATAQEDTAKMQRKTLGLIDGFGEYILSVVYDRLNTSEPDIPGSPEEEAAIAAFRELMEERSGQFAMQEVVPTAALDPSHFGSETGWHPVEQNKSNIPFVWMRRTALIQNPRPHLVTSLVSISVRRILSEEVLPAIVLLDGEPSDVEVLPDSGLGPFRLNATPRSGPRPVHNVQIMANKDPRPIDLNLSADTRRLSFAVDRIDFHYDNSQTKE